MTICIHHNDLDGKCSAAIVNRKLKSSGPVTFFETDYKDDPPNLDMLVGASVIIVDFSYKPEVMKRITERALSVTWVDHHATAKDYPYQHLPGLRHFGDKQKAGCELTWEFFFPETKMPMAVQLIGDYDKWALKMKDSKIFYEGMKLLDSSPTSEIWVDLLSDNHNDVESIIKCGKIAMQYRDNYCTNLRKSFGYETEIAGHKAYACNQYMFGSGGFGEMFGAYPICIAYIHNGETFTVSMYSETIDVGQIAKMYGGGGHKGASGFVCNNLPFSTAR